MVVIMTLPSVPRVPRETSKITPWQKFEGHTDHVCGAIHLSGGQRMMTYSFDGSLRVWNLKSGKHIGDEWRDGKSQVWTMALSPDGKKVASGSMDGEVRLWDIDTEKVIMKWTGHTEGVSSVCWSRDGKRILSGSHDGTVREWGLESGKTILNPIKTGFKIVLAAIYSPDMTMFATGGGERARSDKHPIKIWDAKTGELVATLEGHMGWVWCLAWTKTLISGSADHSVRTWNTTTWKQTAVLDGHIHEVYAITVSPNGRILASASGDNTARLWNLDNNQPISLPVQHAGEVNSVSFSADGKLLATGCDDKNAYTWDVSAIVKESSARLDHCDTPSRPNIFHWVRNLFSTRPSSPEIELHERHLGVIDVPHCQAQRECVRGGTIPLKPKKPAASTSCPPNSNPTQSSGVAQPQQPQAAVLTSFTTPPAVTNTTPTTNPHVIIKHAGRWTRFWDSVCCTSSEYTDDHH